jgi:IclR family acetate operon transcriptional repressor
VAEQSNSQRGSPSDRDREGVQAVERSLDLLELVVRADPEIGLRELSQASGLPVATTHRLLKALMGRQYLRQNPASRRYTVGPAALELAATIGASRNLVQLAEPSLRELVEISQESANLAAVDGTDVVYLAHAEAARMVRMFTQVGNRAPVYATGTGKALLAYMTDPQRVRLLARLRLARYTPHTITDKRLLEAALAEIRERGYALDEGEYEEGVHCIAVPVCDREGRVIAALSISGPSSRLSPQRMAELGPRIRKVADRLSQSL